VFLAAAFGFTGGLLVLVGLVTALYLIDLLFCAYLVTSSMRWTNRHPRGKPGDRKSWPTFTVLCPMYREMAVLPQLMDALTGLDYPADSLQVLLLLEEDDSESIEFFAG
jgi:cellulose synthase/poly-beta-1,6-N-acetylglucosamine synthase-like glycosyltransferase